MNLQETDRLIVAAQRSIEEIPCEHGTGDAMCIRKAHKLPLGRNGRTQFWYGIDCDLPRKKFCGSCLAFWLVAVARNEVLRLAKLASLKEESP